MRVIGPGGLAIVLAAGLAACSAQPPDQATAAGESAVAPPRTYFGARSHIPVRLDMRATADGGRVAPFAGGYRVEVEFEGAGSTRCAVDRGGLAEIAPGSSQPAALLCSAAVELGKDGSRGFRLLEDGNEVGGGVVLP